MANLFNRLIAPFRKRSYEAAGRGPRWNRQPSIANSPAAILAAHRPIAHRARAVVANDPLATSGVEAWVTSLIGTGMKSQSTHPDAETRTALNLNFEQWCYQADADGVQDFYGQQALMCRRLVIDGESFAHLITTADGKLRVRIIDADALDTGLHRVGDGSRIVAGVEFDADGNRVAYHFRHQEPGNPLATPKLVRVPAEDVVHLFRPETPGQVRGISWLTPVLLRIADLSSWRDAQIMRQKIAALLTGFVINNNDGPGNDLAAASLEPGTMVELADGQDVRFSTPPGVGEEVMEFARLTIHEIAAGLGVPYALLSGDLGQATYGSARVGTIGFNRRVEMLQHSVIAFQLLRKVWNRWATLETLSGRVSGQVAQALAVEFVSARTQWLDPAKDAEAESLAIQSGLISRREALAARGLDIERVDATIAADNARAESLGLKFGPVANDNRPAVETA